MIVIGSNYSAITARLRQWAARPLAMRDKQHGGPGIPGFGESRSLHRKIEPEIDLVSARWRARYDAAFRSRPSPAIYAV